ncbi:MAG TPA: hypothetical protein VD969_16710 [Symbiobacteriaceae bacterium]|nr:hypothetical protein [Symbiobacteriaceae bacterium]
MDKRLKAAFLILSMNVSLNGPLVRLAMAEAPPVNLMVPPDLQTGQPGELRVTLGDGFTPSNVTFSVQLKTGDQPDGQWDVVGTDGPDDGFTFMWTPQMAGTYWVRAEADNGPEQVVGSEVETIVVTDAPADDPAPPLGYRLSGVVSLPDSPEPFTVSIRIIGGDVDLTATLGDDQADSDYGKYGLGPALDDQQQPIDGQLRYFFDVPEGDYQITAFAEAGEWIHTQEAAVSASSTTETVELPHGTYYKQSAPLFDPAAQGPSIAWDPISPPPVVNQQSTVTITPTVAEGRAVDGLPQLYVQHQGESPDPVDVGWTELQPVTADGDSYSAEWTPADPGNYWLKAVVTDNTGAQVPSITQSSVVDPIPETPPAPETYKVHGSITLGDGIDKTMVEVEIAGPGITGSIVRQWQPTAAENETDYLTDDGDGLRYEFTVPEAGVYTVSASFNELVADAEVTATAEGAEVEGLMLALPVPELGFPPVEGPIIAGEETRLFAAVTLPAGVTPTTPSFAWQLKAEGQVEAPATGWATITPGAVPVDGGYEIAWTPTAPGEYWLKAELPNADAVTQWVGVGEPQPSLVGSIHLGDGVDRTNVQVRITNADETLLREVTYSAQPTADGFLWDANWPGADPNTLSYGFFDLPDGEYTVEASDGVLRDETEVTVGPNAPFPAMLELYAQQAPAEDGYPVWGSITLDSSVEPEDVELRVEGPGLDGYMFVPYVSVPPQGPGNYITDGPDDGLEYEVILPEIAQDYELAFIVNGQVIDVKTVVTTAEGYDAGDTVLALPTAELHFDPIQPAPVVGDQSQVVVRMALPGNVTAPPPNVYWQARTGDEVPVDGWNLIEAPQMSLPGGDGYSVAWTPANTGDYWLRAEVTDSAGVPHETTMWTTVQAREANLHGNVNFGGDVTPDSVTVRVYRLGPDQEVLFEREVTYSADPTTTDYLTDTRDQNDALIPNSLHYAFDLPEDGTYTVEATSGDYVARTTVVVGPNAEYPLPLQLPPQSIVPQLAYASGDEDADRVYFDGDTISIVVSGLDSLEDGTAVKPVIQLPGPDETSIPLSPSDIASVIVTGGTATVTAVLRAPAEAQHLSGPIELQLLSADGTRPLTERRWVEPSGQRRATFVYATPGPDNRQITPDLREIDNLYDTGVPITVTQPDDYAATYGAGFNLMEAGMPYNIRHAINVQRDHNGYRITVQSRDLPGLAEQGATLTLFGVAANLGLPGLSGETLADHLVFTSEDESGEATPLPSSVIDLMGYDAATDRLTIPVGDFAVIDVSKVPKLSLGQAIYDTRRQDPQGFQATLPQEPTPGTLPGFAVENAAGQTVPGAVTLDSIQRRMEFQEPVFDFQLNPGLPVGQYKLVVTDGDNSWEVSFEARELGLKFSPAVIEEGYSDPVVLTVTNFRSVQAGDRFDVALFEGEATVDAFPSTSVEIVNRNDHLVAEVTLPTGIPAGSYRLTMQNGNLREDGQLNIREPFNVRLTLTDGDGQPLRHKHVGIRSVSESPETPPEWYGSPTDEQGNAFVNLPAGRAYRIVEVGMSEDLQIPLSIPFTAPGAGAPDLHLTVTVDPNVELTVWDEHEDVLPDTEIVIVADDGTGNPVDESPDSLYVSTDADGVAKLQLPAGVYHVIKVGTLRIHKAFTVLEGQAYVGDVELQAPNVLITVRDQNNNPLPHVFVQLLEEGAEPGDSSKEHWIETDSSGVAKATLTRGVTYTVVAVASQGSWTPVNATLTVPASETADPFALEISLRTNVQFTLLDETGVEMPDTWLSIRREGDERFFYATTNGDGAVSETYEPGTYHIVELGNPERYLKTDIEFTVTEESGFTGNLRIPDPSVVIEVTGDGGAPVPEANLQIRPVGGTNQSANTIWARTDKSGIARIDLQRGATYVLVDIGTRNGVVPVAQTFAVPETGTLTRVVPIAPNVQAPVQNEDGEPFIKAMVVIRPDVDGSPSTDWTKVIHAQTNELGTLRVRLAPGTYHVVEIGDPTRYVKTDIPFTVGTGTYTDPIKLAQPNVRVEVVKEGGLPVGRAMVQIRPAAARPEQHDQSIWVETDADGVARVNLTAGVRYRIVDVGTPQGMRPVNKEFTAPDLTLRISVATNVVAILKDEAGQILANSTVGIRPDDGFGNPVEMHDTTIFTHTNGQGILNINLDPDKDYHVVDIGTPKRYVRTDIKFRVTSAGYHNDLQIPVPNLRVKVTGYSGKAWVQVRPVGENQKSVWVETNERGEANIRLTPGTRYLVVDVGTQQGVTRVNKEVTTPAEQNPAQPSELVVSLATNVVATLRDEGGTAMGRAWVTIKPDQGGLPVASFDRAVFTGTNDSGLLTLNLEPGAYHVVEIGSPQRYVRTDIPFTVTADAGYTGNLAIPAPNTKVTVTGNSGPVAKAWVQIRQAGARPDEHDKAIWAETGTNGELKVRLTPSTRYLVVDVGTPQGITLINKEFTTPAAGSSTPVEVAVSLRSNVIVTLKDESDAAIPQARVTIRPVSGGNVESGFDKALFAVTDAQGVFRINLEEGRDYRIVEVASPLRYLRTEIPFSVGEGGIPNGELSLPQPNVTVTVTDDEGPVARAWVQVRPANARPEEHHLSVWTQTNAIGEAHLQLAAGTQYVVVDIGTPQGVTVVNQLFTAPDETVTVSLTDNVTATLENEDGPISNAWVTIRPDGAVPGTAAFRNYYGTTDASGLLSMNLPAGLYRIVEIGRTDRLIRTNLRLDVTGGSFDGPLSVDAPNVRVTVTSGGAAVARAMVQFRPEGARPEDHSAAVWAETNPSGEARVTLPQGNWLLVDVGTPEGITQVSRKFIVGATAQTLPPVSLSANVVRVLRDEMDAPMARTWLAIRPDGATGAGQTIRVTTGDDGVFRVNLEEGRTYRIVEIGNSTRYLRTNLPLAVNADNPDVELDPATAQATVQLANVPVGYAKVAVVQAGADPNADGYWDSVTWFQADEQGNVLMDLAAGDYEIRDVDTPDHRYSFATPILFSVGAGNEEPVLVDLSEGQ